MELLVYTVVYTLRHLLGQRVDLTGQTIRLAQDLDVVRQCDELLHVHTSPAVDRLIIIPSVDHLVGILRHVLDQLKLQRCQVLCLVDNQQPEPWERDGHGLLDQINKVKLRLQVLVLGQRLLDLLHLGEVQVIVFSLIVLRF